MRSSVSLIAVTLGTADVALVEHLLLQIQRAVLMDPNFNTKFYLQKISWSTKKGNSVQNSSCRN